MLTVLAPSPSPKHLARTIFDKATFHSLEVAVWEILGQSDCLTILSPGAAHSDLYQMIEPVFGAAGRPLTPLDLELVMLDLGIRHIQVDGRLWWLGLWSRSSGFDSAPESVVDAWHSDSEPLIGTTPFIVNSAPLTDTVSHGTRSHCAQALDWVIDRFLTVDQASFLPLKAVAAYWEIECKRLRKGKPDADLLRQELGRREAAFGFKHGRRVLVGVTYSEAARRSMLMTPEYQVAECDPILCERH